MSYRKRVYSGMCVCGHDQFKHHGSLVANPDIAKIETRIPGACCAYGHNEFEGRGPKGEDHCSSYKDKTDPYPCLHGVFEVIGECLQGCCDKIKCSVCKHEWLEEIPQ